MRSTAAATNCSRSASVKTSGKVSCSTISQLSARTSSLRQYVVSSTLDPDTDPAVTVVPDDPLALVRELKREEGAGLNVWLCGGGKLAGVLLPEIDELVIKNYPVVAGAGVPAFDGAFGPTVFDVAERTAFPGGVTLTHLVRR